MSVALLLISDGRQDYLQRTIASARTALPVFDQLIRVDDAAHALGFCGAIAAGWSQVDCDYVFHLEQDFTFNRPVDVAAITAVLDRQPHLAQIVLKRQPWNAQERAAGGIVEQHPTSYTERRDGPAVWTEHRRFFSTNPSVYRRELCELGWPQVPQSEGIFTHQLLADPDLQFAFWGAKHAPPLVEHIGEQRAGTRY